MLGNGPGSRAQVTPDSRECRPDLRRVSCETVAAVPEDAPWLRPEAMFFDENYVFSMSFDEKF